MPRKSQKSGVSDKPLQLRIVLLDVEPQIWRRVIVPPSLNLRELHAVIQGAMGWQDSHLHSFEIEGRIYEVPFESGTKIADESTVRLDTCIVPGTNFLYVYDFGDNWKHSVTVEHAITAVDERNLPICIAGERACPPEDCGGTPGYQSLLEALANPNHSQHRAMKDWSNNFLPDAFNTVQANTLIKALCALYRERRWGFL